MLEKVMELCKTLTYMVGVFYYGEEMDIIGRHPRNYRTLCKPGQYHETMIYIRS